MSTGDLEGYLSLFADDAVWVTPELDEIVGREAIREWLAPVFAQFDYELTITVADVRVAGDLGIERARFLSRMTPKTRSTRPDSGLAGGEARGGAEGVGDLFDADRAADDAAAGVGGVPAGSVQADIGGGGDLVEGAGDEGTPEGDDGALQVVEGEAGSAVADAADVGERSEGDAEGGDGTVDAASAEDGRTAATVEHEHEHEGEGEHEAGAGSGPEPLVSGEPWGDTAAGSGGEAEPVGSTDLGGPASISETGPADVDGGDAGVFGDEGVVGDEGVGGDEGAAAGGEAEPSHAEVDRAVTDVAPDADTRAADESPPLPLGPDEGDHEPHEGRYLMYWRWHADAGWLVQRYADVTGVG